GLLGTKFTMQHDFFTRSFEQAGIKVVTPDDQEQVFIHRKIIDELENGVVNPETKQQLLGIIMNLIHTERLDGIILGCTELPLIIKPADLSVN
ncbi:aspartate/glutamate racemase family protein, partial [Lactiplantibacillus plantarum]